MKINSAIPPIGTAPESGRPGAAKAPAQSAASSGGTQVEFSLSARVESTLAGSPVVDAQRVTEIKQAIAEGRFKVDPERIADGLLSSVREMLSKYQPQ